ncbi:MAG: PPC domain-containing protein [Kiritimatiellae bacterium]|nr:PPC domain-containing protein [Kiritimatiellia bacterium]
MTSAVPLQIGRARTPLAAVLAVATATAQVREPHAGYIFPAGGMRGTTFEAVLGGQYIEGATNLLVSGGGVSAQILRHVRLLAPQQLNGIRNNFEKYIQLVDMGRTNAQRKAEAEELKQRLIAQLREIGIDEFSMRALQEYRRMMSDPKRQVNPAISEYVKLRITIAPDATPGDREVRMIGALGMTNPLRFQVGVLPEKTEKEPNDTGPNVVAGELPLVLNGQIMPGDVDRFRIRARKGERLVAWAQARALIPYLADAVPGWFQAVLSLRDLEGRELAYCDDNRFDPDPVISVEIPADGEYDLEIRDAIYRGREDFVYRIAVGRIPYIQGIYPLGGPLGRPTTVQLTGWNLPNSAIPFTPAAAGVQKVAVRAGELLSNWQPFLADTWPELYEREPNDDSARATAVVAPVIANGRIGAPGDRDVYRFEASAGVKVVAEVFARRLNSPLDSLLRIADAAGREIAANDDFNDKGAGLVTHQADSRIEVTMPSNGVYTVTVADAQGKGGPDYAYRLRLGVPRPDFELRVVPATVNVRPGQTVALTVHVLRRDGFDGPVELRLTSPTNGWSLTGARIPAGADHVRVTLTGPATARGTEPVALKMEGVATISGREVRRAATPADDLMQAFFYRHLVPAESWLAWTVSSRFGPMPPVQLVGATPVRLSPGATASVRVRVPMGAGRRRFQLDLSDPPEGIGLDKANWSSDQVELLFKADPEKAKAGTSGNLIVEILADAGGRRVPVGVLPAIPFEIVRN